MAAQAIFGLDFTSAPSRRKPITCAAGTLDGTRLSIHDVLKLDNFGEFEAFLNTGGPWVAALDFPFGQPHKLLVNLGWPTKWKDYTQKIAKMGKSSFEEELLRYSKSRPMGDKLHRRMTDDYAGACSPMMLHRVPVAKMYFQGAPRLLAAGVSVWPCQLKDDNRMVVEGYPALVARKWIGKRSYKSDERSKQTREQKDARKAIMAGLLSHELELYYGVEFVLAERLADELITEPTGDYLDAVLCTVQAAWVQLERRSDMLMEYDNDEGWIADPQVRLSIPKI